MKKFWDKTKIVFVLVARGVAGLLLAIFAVLLVRDKKANERELVAEEKRLQAENAVRNSSARTVAERYEGVGDAVDAGRARFAARVKNRVIAAGGRRIDEQHPE